MSYNVKSWIAQILVSGVLGAVFGAIRDGIGLSGWIIWPSCVVGGMAIGVVFEHFRQKHAFYEKYPFAEVFKR